MSTADDHIVLNSAAVISTTINAVLNGVPTVLVARCGWCAADVVVVCPVGDGVATDIIARVAAEWPFVVIAAVEDEHGSRVRERAIVCSCIPHSPDTGALLRSIIEMTGQ